MCILGILCLKRCERQALVPDPIQRGTPLLTVEGRCHLSIRHIHCHLPVTQYSADQGRLLRKLRRLRGALSRLLHVHPLRITLPPYHHPLRTSLPVFFLHFLSLPLPDSPGRLLPMRFLSKRDRIITTRENRSHAHQATRTMSCLRLLWTRSLSQEASWAGQG